jgi:hypothetical protein
MSHQPSNTLQRTLACLASPLTLLSLTLLLLNDHLLKATIPSWFTGKLSDFAGLYFFPFVLTALFSLLRQPPTRTATLAFTLTAVSFTLIKTIPPITTLTESFWSQLIGAPVQIIPDPTDLIALVVLIPAWKLWQRPPRPSRYTTHPLIGWATLGLASLASLASSCEVIPIINRLAIIDNVLYTSDGVQVAQYDEVSGEWHEVIEPSPVFTGQQTPEPLLPATACAPTPSHLCDPAAGNENDNLPPEWAEVVQLPSRLRPELATAGPLPVTACVPSQPHSCYRITGDEKVYSSSDGGETWQVAWEIPAGRRDFMDRYPSGCKGAIDMGPYDLLILPELGGYRVVVAIGKEGLVVRQPNGDWIRQEVLRAGPTPFSTTDIGNVLDILQQEEFYLGLLTLLILSSVIVITQRSFWPLAIPFFVTILVAGPIGLFTSFWTYPPYIATFFMVGIGVITLASRWKKGTPTPSDEAVWLWFLSGVGVFTIGNIPFWLWVFGLIPIYNWAVTASVLAILLFLPFAGRHVLRLSKTAA